MPNNHFIPKLITVLKNEESIFLVMELKRSDLATLFKEDQPQNFSLSYEHHFKVIVYNLLCAINFLHSARIIHRDLKPSNILIDENCNVFICDFGLARSIEGSNEKRRNKTPDVSTRWYRSPETILRCPDYNEKIDMWAIGCVINELLSFTDENRSRIKDPVLFKGTSCYPQSPSEYKLDAKNKKKISVSKNDQLIKIIQ